MLQLSRFVDSLALFLNQGAVCFCFDVVNGKRNNWTTNCSSVILKCWTLWESGDTTILPRTEPSVRRRFLFIPIDSLAALSHFVELAHWQQLPLPSSVCSPSASTLQHDHPVPHTDIPPSHHTTDVDPLLFPVFLLAVVCEEAVLFRRKITASKHLESVVLCRHRSPISLIDLVRSLPFSIAGHAACFTAHFPRHLSCSQFLDYYAEPYSTSVLLLSTSWRLLTRALLVYVLLSQMEKKTEHQLFVQIFLDVEHCEKVTTREFHQKRNPVSGFSNSYPSCSLPPFPFSSMWYTFNNCISPSPSAHIPLQLFTTTILHRKRIVSINSLFIAQKTNSFNKFFISGNMFPLLFWPHCQRVSH